MNRNFRSIWLSDKLSIHSQRKQRHLTVCTFAISLFTRANCEVEKIMLRCETITAEPIQHFKKVENLT